MFPVILIIFVFHLGQGVKMLLLCVMDALDELCHMKTELFTSHYLPYWVISVYQPCVCLLLCAVRFIIAPTPHPPRNNFLLLPLKPKQ